jgi:hypothetical protein
MFDVEKEADLSEVQKRIGRPLLKQMGQIMQRYMDAPAVRKIKVWDPDSGDPKPPGFPAMGLLYDCIEECMDRAIAAERERAAGWADRNQHREFEKGNIRAADLCGQIAAAIRAGEETP